MDYSKIFTIILHDFFFDWGEINFEHFNIFENNIINVELAKLLGYITTNLNTISVPC
jgi:hypothetical protein